jgi:hypothetical protein
MSEYPYLHHINEKARGVITPRGILARMVREDEVNGARFILCFPIFPARMTLFHEKMTLLSEGIAVLVPD